MKDFQFDFSDFSKDELAFMVTHIMRHQKNDFLFRDALLELEIRKIVEHDMERIEKAEALCEAAAAKRREADELLAPWREPGSGLPPLDIQQRHARLVAEAAQLEKNFRGGRACVSG